MGKTNNFELIVPRGPDFRDNPIDEAFTWEDGIEIGTEGLGVTNFVSKRNHAVPKPLIRKLLGHDFAVAKDAETRAGFGAYWHDDELSPELVASSFCIWQTVKHGFDASQTPVHRAAVDFIRSEGKCIFEYYRAEIYVVRRPAEKVLFERVTRSLAAA